MFVAVSTYLHYKAKAKRYLQAMYNRIREAFSSNPEEFCGFTEKKKSEVKKKIIKSFYILPDFFVKLQEVWFHEKTKKYFLKK